MRSNSLMVMMSQLILTPCVFVCVRAAAAAGSDAIQPPPLAYKKWGLQDVEAVVDHSSVGEQSPSPLPQLTPDPEDWPLTPVPCAQA